MTTSSSRTSMTTVTAIVIVVKAFVVRARTPGTSAIASPAATA